jgi:hypothetical protein
MSGDTGLTCVASNTGIRATIQWNVASDELRNASHCGVTDRLGEMKDLVEMLEAFEGSRK